MLFLYIKNLINYRKVRHQHSRFKIVNMYNHNNARNLFTVILVINSSIISYIIYKYYNRILDIIYLILYLILAIIQFIRTL